jgi:hypothetical protein
MKLNQSLALGSIGDVFRIIENVSISFSTPSDFTL